MKRNGYNRKITSKGENRVWKTEAYKLYQELCGRVFGKGAVKIGSAPANNITELLRYVDDVVVPGSGGIYDIWETRSVKVQTFKKKLEARLMRLRERMAATPEYLMLLDTVRQVAHPINGDMAYAKLAAWDVMWYEGICYLESLESFSVGLLEDPELDRRKVLPIAWEYDPYQMVSQSKDLVRKKFGNDILKRGVNLVVLVKVPWVSEENRYFEEADYTFYRALARRTFMDKSRIRELENSGLTTSKETDNTDIFIKKLGGVIVIDEGREDAKSICHAFKNPNSELKDDEGLNYTLLDVTDEGDMPGVYEDFRYDNY